MEHLFILIGSLDYALRSKCDMWITPWPGSTSVGGRAEEVRVIWGIHRPAHSGYLSHMQAQVRIE